MIKTLNEVKNYLNLASKVNAFLKEQKVDDGDRRSIVSNIADIAEDAIRRFRDSLTEDHKDG